MKSAQQNNSDDLYAVARITGCFGIKGYLKVLPLTHSPERLNDLSVIRIGVAENQTIEAEVERVAFQPNSIHLKLKGIDDRTQAENYAGKYIFVPADELVAPPKGSWFIHEIIGCECFLADGTPLGVVKDVWQMPASDLWEIVVQGKSVMVPSTKEIVRKVEIAKQRITLAPPDGLFDL